MSRTGMRFSGLVWACWGVGRGPEDKLWGTERSSCRVRGGVWEDRTEGAWQARVGKAVRGRGTTICSATQTCCCMLFMRSRFCMCGTLWGSPTYKPWSGPRGLCHWFSPTPAELCPSRPVTKPLSQCHAMRTEQLVRDLKTLTCCVSTAL